MSSDIIFPFVRLHVPRQVRDDELEHAMRNGFDPYFFTFGCGQAFPNYCACVWASNEEKAREMMGHLFGDRWAFCYDIKGITDYKRRWPIEMIGEYVGD